MNLSNWARKIFLTWLTGGGLVYGLYASKWIPVHPLIGLCFAGAAASYLSYALFFKKDDTGGLLVPAVIAIAVLLAVITANAQTIRTMATGPLDPVLLQSIRIKNQRPDMSPREIHLWATLGFLFSISLFSIPSVTFGIWLGRKLNSIPSGDQQNT